MIFMDRTKLNFIVDALMAVAFFALFVTGIMKFPILALHRYIQMGTFTFIHDWSGVILGLLVIVHIILHLNWFVCMIKKYFLGGGKKCEQ